MMRGRVSLAGCLALLPGQIDPVRKEEKPHHYSGDGEANAMAPVEGIEFLSHPGREKVPPFPSLQPG